jgi:hypothetical protein
MLRDDKSEEAVGGAASETCSASLICSSNQKSIVRHMAKLTGVTGGRYSTRWTIIHWVSLPNKEYNEPFYALEQDQQG